VGSRRHDGVGDLLAAFGAAAATIDLDRPEYFALDDLAAYALASLRLAGDEREDNPYAPDNVAAPVARRIAELANRNFLVAGLVARDHGLHDTEAVRPDASPSPPRSSRRWPAGPPARGLPTVERLHRGP